jgi:Permease for cytosine/purines, uracil, thiamine, allantoin
VLATVISCAIGAYLAALLPSLGPVAAVSKVSGTWALVVMALSLVNANTFNAYTGAFQVLAFGSMWRRFRSESVTVRLIPYVCVMAAGVAIAYLGHQSFVADLSNFLDVLLVIFIPWSAVNLADYFLVRRGRYDVASLIRRRRRLRPARLARPAGLRPRLGRRMALRLPAGLHRPTGQDARRSRRLLAGRMVHRRHRLPAPGRPDRQYRPPRPARRPRSQITGTETSHDETNDHQDAAQARP